MPKVYGTLEQKQQLTDLINRYQHLFGPAPKGGSLMSELDIKVKPGAKASYQPPRRVSPAIQQIIAEDTAMRIANGWMEKAPNEFARYGSPIVVALQKGKHRVCTDYPSIRLLSLADIPLKMSNRHLSSARAARFGARWTCAKDSINFA